MTSSTTCDRCGHVGPFKGNKDMTTSFPANVEAKAQRFGGSTSWAWELCDECTAALLDFLGADDELEEYQQAAREREETDL